MKKKSGTGSKISSIDSKKKDSATGLLPGNTAQDAGLLLGQTAQATNLAPGKTAKTPKSPPAKPALEPGEPTSETLTLEWTKEARLQIFPRRGFPYEGYEPPRDPALILQKMRKRYQSYQYELRSDLAEGDARKLMKRVNPFMNNAGDPADVDAEAAAAVLLGINEEHPYVQEERGPFWIADYWVALKGCAFAVQVMVSTFSLGISHNDEYFDSGSEFGVAPPSYSWLSEEQGHAPVFEQGNASLPFTLRFHLAATFDEDYEAARSWAAICRLSQPLIVRCALACAFPDEEQWSIEAFRECMKKVNTCKSFPAFGKPLLTSLKDPALIETLLKEADLSERELFYGPTILDNLGPKAAFPLLRTLLDAVPASYLESTREARRMGASTIASIRGEAVADYFISYCNDKDISSIASGYIRKHPRLACDPLESAMKKEHDDHIDVLLAYVKKALEVDMHIAAKTENVARSIAVESDSEALPAALREDIGARTSSLPSFWEITALTRPRLRTGNQELPDMAMVRLGRLCASAGSRNGRAMLLEVIDSLEPHSYDSFLWDLFCSWEMAGAPSRGRWAFDALSYPGTDDLLYRLANKAAKWKKEHLGPRAAMALEVLAKNGGHTALAILYAFSQTEGSGHPSGAEELFNEAAATQHLSPNKLALKVLPETGLDHTGARLFTFDSGTYRAGFNDALEPYIVDQHGGRVDNFPSPESENEIKLITEIKQWWDSVKQYVAFYGHLQRQLLVRASDFDDYPSVDWKAEGFMIFMAGRSYAPHLVRSALFGRFDSDLPYGYVPDKSCTGIFMIADDGTPLDHRERPITFKSNSVVAIPSPYQTFPGYLGAMKKVFTRHNRTLLFGAFSQRGAEKNAPGSP